MRQAQRTAVGDFRNLRQGIRARLARLNQYGGPDIGLTAPGGWPDRLADSPSTSQETPLGRDAISTEASASVGTANRLVSNSTRANPKESSYRDQSDCRGVGTSSGDCAKRVSPPCVGWGTPLCSRSDLGASLVMAELLLAQNSQEAAERLTGIEPA